MIKHKITDKEFPKRLNALREQRGMTYRELAKEIYATEFLAHDWCHRTCGSLLRLKLICKKFDVSADYLLGLSEE